MVIAIIAILAAILFPVFARARENARKTTYLNNVKQQGLAAMQYAQDYDERFMPACTPGAGTPRLVWMDLIAPYCKNTGIFVCPSYSGRSTSTCGAAYTNRPSAPWLSGGYAMNTWGAVGQLGTTQYGPGSNGGVAGATGGLPLAAMTRPADLILYTEVSTASGTTNCCEIGVATQMAGGNLDGGVYAVSKRHSGGFCATFCDGHGKWLATNAAKYFGGD